MTFVNKLNSSPDRSSVPQRPAKLFLAVELHGREEHIDLGQFPSIPDAIGACQEMVDTFLNKHYRKGWTGKQLYERYLRWGGDLYVDAALGAPLFDGLKYANKRAEELCGCW